MIIVKLIGGLGNQMFQYAVGRRLARINNTKLKFDISQFKKYPNRKYSLNYFNIKGSPLNYLEILKLKILKKINIIKTIKEKNGFCFDKEILNLSDNISLDGYWQSEKYFKNIENSIRKEFTLKNDLQIKAKNLLQKIKNTESISIHIRRGDYVNNEKINQYHGICPLEYYYAAVKKISQVVKNPHFFIFSDDINWCKKNLKIKFPVIFVEGNKDYEDLILMSKCKHNIIANSTFSWWGAWLNNNPNKIIIAPQKWNNDSSINTNDIIPETWIKI